MMALCQARRIYRLPQGLARVGWIMRSRSSTSDILANSALVRVVVPLAHPDPQTGLTALARPFDGPGRTSTLLVGMSGDSMKIRGEASAREGSDTALPS